MKGRKFTDLSNGRIVQVKDVFEDIVILEDNSKIRLNRLVDKSYYDEFIDPKTFFKNESLLNTFADKIKQIPDNVIKKMGNEERIYESDDFNQNITARNQFEGFDEPAVLPADPELEKQELMRKYGITDNPILEAQKQLEKFKNLLEDNPVGEVTTFNVDRVEEAEEWLEEDENIDYVEPLEERVEPVKKEKVMQKIEEKKTEDPIIAMFKNVKRNRPFKISINLENMIPRADFIEMMEDSYNTSIIEFLADEFTAEIIKNPAKIKNMITSEIKKIVYGETEQEVKSEIKGEKKTEEKSKPKRVGRKKREIADDTTTVN
jgi:hypothetical protein